jgi:hypothetical protein
MNVSSGGLMRWFDDAAYEADDEAWDAIMNSYYAHARSIAPSLPPDLARLALAPDLNLHDARFEHVVVNLTTRTVTIAVRVEGGRRLTLQFAGATIVPDDLQRLGYAVGAEFRPQHWRQRRGVTEILAQEVDLLPDGRYTLRLRLWPFHQFAVEFADFTLSEELVTEPSRTRAGSFVVHGTRDE